MGFDATEISSLWDYTLGDGTKGRVPEPTMAEAEKYRDQFTTEQLALCGLTLEQVEGKGGSALFTERLNALTHSQRVHLNETMIESAIEFCKGSPTRDQITEMPALTQYEFVLWLVRTLSPLF